MDRGAALRGGLRGAEDQAGRVRCSARGVGEEDRHVS
jgi:hypothetical protein